jgi:phospholipid N-methyltransferase
MRLSKNKIILLFLFSIVLVNRAFDALDRIPIFTFLVEAMKKQNQVGAFAPSSSYVAKEILRFVQEDNTVNKKILEVGAGIGNITEFIQKVLKDGDILDVVEFDSEYCKILNEKFGQYKNINIINGSILNWNPNYKYDFIISTLPHTALDKQFVEKLIPHYKALIKPNGFLSYIEYIGFAKLSFLKVWGQARKLYKDKLKQIRQFKEKNKFQTNIVIRNLPPTFVHHLKL